MIMRRYLPNGKTIFDIIAPTNQAYIQKKKIVISDCDGILTDGTSIYDSTKKSFKTYGSYDSEMVTFLKKYNWDFVFVSKDLKGFDITNKRIEDMHCKLTQANEFERANLVKYYKEEENYLTVFIGDSLSDIMALNNADIACCTSNAFYKVDEYCDYQSKKEGGHGGFGEILYWLNEYLNSSY